MTGKKAAKCKKASLNLLDNWVELVSIALLLLGILIAVISTSAIITYFTILFCGTVVGRNFYLTRRRRRFHFYYIAGGFFIGFLVGAYVSRYGNLWIISFLFFMGVYFGYYLHRKRHLG